ncbi:MAG: hypothetical protein C0599_06545 [Salinivirgaceae bacterium]|nr:MAG: hypothetical protein C0599_06545 [Salinivirgaceae bacterium]
MKSTLTLLFLIFTSFLFAQVPVGSYEGGLKLAYDNDTKTVTGYFESHSGFDQNTGAPRFSCVFYLKGTFTEGIGDIVTYYPGDEEGAINGKLKFYGDGIVSIKLDDDHGGCANVQVFSDAFQQFQFSKLEEWKAIKYVKADKAYFHNEKTDASKRKAYVLQNDIVYIEKIEGDWMYCAFIGKSTTKGWIKKSELND